MKLFSLLCILTWISVEASSLKFQPLRHQNDVMSSELNELWTEYKETYGKSYDMKEDVVRRSLWEGNLRHISMHNVKHDLGKHSFSMGINELSDLTPSEYRQRLGLRPALGERTGKKFVYNGEKVPEHVDWRDKGYVTPVKNQGACGSCWAFSSTGSLEGQHFRLTGQLVSLSEQNLVDCTKKYGNAGCNGGWMDNAFNYVKANNGIDTEAFYPYEGHDDWCGYDGSPGHKGANCTGHVDVQQGDELALKQAVATVGPVSVGIDATHRSFQLYKSGIYDEVACSNSSTDHAVLVVGYGSQGGHDYWLVKNSWGTSWGMDGYIMMSRNKGNQCAIASYASYPTE
ncbi:hypothetical protein CAPTEDRAFT_173171 [Capitella teleta]|uniref:Uncharacterized protein n=1 Tax=Capitella teleta TaxID=283909 RepID=R7TW49_CAPTE|nr:hypothetical protein CAPTEDRAFT_173171 [Capitella teleta]|eukprot:ELT95681.1 hypothetical protein CAPTEDRAFT_173171 [Capitella teleta]